MGLNLQKIRAKKGYDIYSRWSSDNEGIRKVISKTGISAQKQNTKDFAKEKSAQNK